MQQYCAGYAICACCVRKQPFRPICLRMAERVQMLAGDAYHAGRAVLTVKLCRFVPTGRPARYICRMQCMPNPCAYRAAAGCLESRCRWHMHAVPCDPCDPVTISANENRLCLEPVITSGRSCVCAELGGSGKLAGDRGGNLEPRVAASRMQGRSSCKLPMRRLGVVCDRCIT